MIFFHRQGENMSKHALLTEKLQFLHVTILLRLYTVLHMFTCTLSTEPALTCFTAIRSPMTIIIALGY
jgi:hypothetical protein